MWFLESDLLIVTNGYKSMSVNKHCVSWLITLVQEDKVVNWLHVWVFLGYFVANMLSFVALGYYTTSGNCVGWVYKNYLHLLYCKYPLKIGEHYLRWLVPWEISPGIQDTVDVTFKFSVYATSTVSADFITWPFWVLLS